jgi:predicted nucleotidyltransferase
MDDKVTIEKKIKTILENRNEILFAYIFGSFITSEKYQDIDIAFFVNQGFDFKNLETYPFGYEAAIIGSLSLGLKTDKVDIILLNSADLLVSTQIYNSGKLLFDKDKLLRVKIENSARKEFIDTNHFRLIRSKNLRRLLNV